MRTDLRRALVAELLGTGLLLAAVVGSGIMAERLSAGNVAIALLANTMATGAALLALIVTFASVSGAHFNPVVTVTDAWSGGVPWTHVPLYLLGQGAGAIGGVVAAHLMFGEPALMMSVHERSGGAQVFSEFVATFGLVSVIASCSRRQPAHVPYAVAAYIVAAYWFTASTSFANPAVTLARALTDTFAGIRLADVPGFVAGQCLGAASAAVVFRWLVPAWPDTGARFVHEESV